jgi:uncharacterized protein DUF6884
MRDIAVVGCGAAKLDHPAPAADLYTGGLYRACRAYAEHAVGEWVILSALHGIVTPETILEPYDKTWTTMPAWERRARTLAHATSVTNWLARRQGGNWNHGHARRLGEGFRLILLCGADYRAVVETARDHNPRWAAELVTPMAGLGIGQQLAWLKANTP